MPVRAVSTSAKTSTRASSDTPSSRGRPPGISGRSASIAQRATSNPPAPPTNAMTTLSVAIRRNSWRGPAPRAERRANSRSRDAPRATSRLAAFAHATSSRIATAPRNTSSVGRTGPTIWSRSGATRTPQSRFVCG